MTPESPRDSGLGPPARRSGGGTLVVQPLPGIGDSIWHLPHLRAIARASPDGRVTLLTKARSLADRLFAAVPAIGEVLWLHRNRGEHDGLLGALRLAGLLRPRRFGRVWILHSSARYAVICRLAGIPVRHGYGLDWQRWFLTEPAFLPSELAGAHPIEKATALLKANGLEFMEADHELPVLPDAARRIEVRFGSPTPWIAFAIGTSEAVRQWGADNFAALAEALHSRARCTVFLVGGPAERGLSASIHARIAANGGAVEDAVGLPIEETAALLARCRLCVGNDTGAMNVAAAVGTESVGLFGCSQPPRLPRLHVVLPPRPEAGMQGIAVAQVVAAIGKLGVP